MFVQTFMDVVKKTKVPIIFICNDIYFPKLKALNYCYDIYIVNSFANDMTQTIN